MPPDGVLVIAALVVYGVGLFAFGVALGWRWRQEGRDAPNDA